MHGLEVSAYPRGESLLETARLVLCHAVGLRLHHAVGLLLRHDAGLRPRHAVGLRLHHAVGLRLRHTVRIRLHHADGLRLRHTVRIRLHHADGLRLRHIIGLRLRDVVGLRLRHTVGTWLRHAGRSPLHPCGGYNCAHRPFTAASRHLSSTASRRPSTAVDSGSSRRNVSLVLGRRPQPRQAARVVFPVPGQSLVGSRFRADRLPPSLPVPPPSLPRHTAAKAEESTRGKDSITIIPRISSVNQSRPVRAVRLAGSLVRQ